MHSSPTYLPQTRGYYPTQSSSHSGIGYEAVTGYPVQRQAGSAIASATNGPTAQGNLPDKLRSGVERLSGVDMSDVQVHYNSGKPAQLKALAYAQGNQIHVGPGQEKHLAHEAWHVVQQKQNRVKPTMQMKGAAVNDAPALEREADVMGARALNVSVTSHTTAPVQRQITGASPLQCMWAPASIQEDVEQRLTSANYAGGTSGQTYFAKTSGANNAFVLKITTSDYFMYATKLAKQMGIPVPDATIIGKTSDAVAALKSKVKPKQKTPAIDGADTIIMAFEQLDGAEHFDPDQFMDKPNGAQLVGLGEIAAYDMAIGKVDLFENFTEADTGGMSGINENNYKNLMLKDDQYIDIDLDGRPGNLDIDGLDITRLDVIDQIIARPLEVHPYVARRVLRYFEMSAGRQNRNALQVQLGILQLVGRTTEADVKLGADEKHQSASSEMLAGFLERAGAARAAAEHIQKALLAAMRKPVAAKPKAQPKQGGAKKKKKADGDCCIIL